MEALLKELFRGMFEVQRAYFDCVRERMGSEMGVYPQQGPILNLLLQNDGLSQAELARRLNVTAATVAVSVARLEKLGYVRRERNEQNHRAYVLTLSDKGRAETQKLLDKLAEVREMALSDFSSDEIKSLIGYCQRIVDSLRAEYQTGEERERPCTKC